ESNTTRSPQGQQATFANTKRIFDKLADKVTQYEWGKEVAPGITALDTNGHTPGHTSFQIASGWYGHLPGRCHRRLCAALYRQSGLACWRGFRRAAGGRDAAQALRHARDRPDSDVGLSHPVPLARAHREDGERLPIHSGELESYVVGYVAFRLNGD